VEGVEVPKMMDKDVQWLNLRYVPDAPYTRVDQAPILTQLIQENDGFFWDGQGWCYIIERIWVKRFPDWRSTLRIDYENQKSARKMREMRFQKKFRIKKREVVLQ
jgi:hypothetical protein